MSKVLVLADDFTGALDTGVQFAASGSPVLVATAEYACISIFADECGADRPESMPDEININTCGCLLEKQSIVLTNVCKLDVQNLNNMRQKAGACMSAKINKHEEQDKACANMYTQLYDKTPVRYDRAYDVLVIDTETRHVSSAVAAKVIKQLTRAAVRLGYRYFYKKTDSALRGNIGAELGAMLSSCGAPVLSFAPAFPKSRRATIGGVHYIDGTPLSESVFAHDPFEPAKYSEVKTIVSEQTDAKINTLSADIYKSWHESTNKTYYTTACDSSDKTICGVIDVYDAESDEDLAQLGRYLKSRGKLKCLAGCAGFAAVLPDLYEIGIINGSSPDGDSSAAHNARNESMLLVTGSVNPITINQLSRASMNGLHLITLTPEQKIYMPRKMRGADGTGSAGGEGGTGGIGGAGGVGDADGAGDTGGVGGTNGAGDAGFACEAGVMGDMGGVGSVGGVGEVSDADGMGSASGEGVIEYIVKCIREKRYVAVTAAASADDIEATDAYARQDGIPPARLRDLICSNIGYIAANVLMRCPIDILAVFGGDTLYEILRQTGVHAIFPTREITPGIVESEILSEQFRFRLITKSGGLGGDSAIEDIMQCVKR